VRLAGSFRTAFYAVIVVAAFPSIPQSSAQLQLIWERTYAGSGNGSDIAHGVAVDGNGGVVAAGSGWEPGKYVWLVRKYDDSGGLLWSRSYTSIGAVASDASDVAAGPDGSIVAAGYETTANTHWLVEKYDASGVLLWSRSHTRPGYPFTSASAVAVDGDGNAVVVGAECNPGMIGDGSSNWLVRKYDGSGNLLWSRSNNTGGKSVAALDVAVDAGGNIVVVGSRNDGFMQGCMIEKYDRDGNYLWGQPGGVWIGGGTYRNSAVAVDANGNVAVVQVMGMCQPGPVGGYICAGGTSLLFYDPGGTLLWSTSFNESVQGFDNGQDVVVDRSGHILVTGNRTTGDPDKRIHWFFRKHDRFGNLLLNETWESPAGMDNGVGGVAIGGAGSILAAGYEQQKGQTVTANWVVRKFRESGSVSAAVPSPDVIVYPNPVKGDQFTVEFVDLGEDIAELDLQLFNVAFDRVYRAAWRDVSRAEPRVKVDGVRNWAPGVYLLRVKGTLAGGGPIRFPTKKVVVKR